MYNNLETKIIKDMENEGKIIEILLFIIGISFIIGLTVLFVK